MTIALQPLARTGDKLADMEDFARLLASLDVPADTDTDSASVNTARTIGDELIRILKGKPRTELVLGTD